MIIVGDCGGQFQAVLRMHDQLSRSYPDDKWVFVGDVIDRGPESAQLIKWLRENKHTVLYGNHEDMMVDFIDAMLRYENTFRRGQYGNDWMRNGGQETLFSYFPEKGLANGRVDLSSREIVERTQDDVEWMKSLPRYHETEDLIITHAPIPGGHAQWREYVTGNPMAIWNRYPPKSIPGKFQVFGHNGCMTVYDHNGHTKPFAMCIDDSHQGNVSALVWPDQTIFKEKFGPVRNRNTKKKKAKEAEDDLD